MPYQPKPVCEVCEDESCSACLEYYAGYEYLGERSLGSDYSDTETNALAGVIHRNY